MSTHMKAAQERLFGREGLGASNFKMYPGYNRDTSSEEVARQVAASIDELTAKLAAGDLVESALD